MKKRHRIRPTAGRNSHEGNRPQLPSALSGNFAQANATATICPTAALRVSLALLLDVCRADSLGGHELARAALVRRSTHSRPRPVE